MAHIRVFKINGKTLIPVAGDFKSDLEALKSIKETGDFIFLQTHHVEIPIEPKETQSENDPGAATETKVHSPKKSKSL